MDIHEQQDDFMIRNWIVESSHALEMTIEKVRGGCVKMERSHDQNWGKKLGGRLENQKKSMSECLGHV